MHRMQNMTHVTNSIQELHDKIQTSLTHTVDCEARFNCTKSEQNILDECIDKLTAKERKIDKSLLESVDKSKSRMGNTFKVKKDLKHNSASKKVNSMDHVVDEKTVSSTSDCEQASLPVVMVSHFNVHSKDCISNQASDAKLNNCDRAQNSVDVNISSSSEVVEKEIRCASVSVLESSRSPTSDFGKKLSPDDSVILHRDSAYGSSSESAQAEQINAESSGVKNVTTDSFNLNCQVSTSTLSTSTLTNSTTLANKWSSSSSIASDYATEAQGSADDPEIYLCGGLLGSSNFKSLSSSTFSLR